MNMNSFCKQQEYVGNSNMLLSISLHFVSFHFFLFLFSFHFFFFCRLSFQFYWRNIQRYYVINIFCLYCFDFFFYFYFSIVFVFILRKSWYVFIFKGELFFLNIFPNVLICKRHSENFTFLQRMLLLEKYTPDGLILCYNSAYKK